MIRNRHVLSLGVGVLTGLASSVISLLALERASGVTKIGRSSFDTEFIDGGTLQLAWLLLPLAAAAGWLSLRAAVLAVVGATVPLVFAMTETVNRYRESGWADGLEVLGYLLPAAVLVGATGSALVGWTARSVTTSRR